MTREALFTQIKLKGSFLCIGLDTDPEKIPPSLLSFTDPVVEFNRQIIDATHDLCVAYKLNTAFYEASGVKGWARMQRTLEYIPADIFTIADAKRGDIGNTSMMYARAFFDPERSGFEFDALTVAPYMGEDSVTPFLSYPDKWVILLALTSNKGSRDFQIKEGQAAMGERPLYEQVILKAQQWGNADNMMFVVGATHPEMFSHLRRLAPDHFFLVPGVGTQGGELKSVAKEGMNRHCGLLVNVSRQIIYASSEKNFAEAARHEAQKMQQEMSDLLETIPL